MKLKDQDESINVQKNNPIPPKPQEKIENFKIFFDSSFLIALINEKDANHKFVTAIFNFAGPCSCGFYLYSFVAAEVISKLVRQFRSVPKALQFFEKLEKILSKSGNYYCSKDIWSIDEIVKRYKKIQKKQIKFLQFNDFFIATEGVLLGGIILTCDVKMYKKVKPYYKEIYLIAPDAHAYKNDIPKLIKVLTGKK